MNNSIPTAFNKAKEVLLKEDGFSISEDHSVIRIANFRYSDEEGLKQLRALINIIKSENFGECILTGEVLRDVDVQQITIDV